VLLSEDVADGETRGGAGTELVFFFGSEESTRAVPEGVVPVAPGETGWPGVTVTGRCGITGMAVIRFVGGGGGGTAEVFFASVVRGVGAASTFSGVAGGGTTVVFFSSATGGGEEASTFAGVAGGIGTAAVFFASTTGDGASASCFAEVGSIFSGRTGCIGSVIAGMPAVVFRFICGGCKGGAMDGIEPVVLLAAFSVKGGATGWVWGLVAGGVVTEGGTGPVAGFAAGSSLATTTGTGGFVTGARIGAD
jgi:hypothetical protein